MRATPLSALRTVLLAGALAAPALPAFAQATAEEAARLQGVGETYFGKPAAGETGVVKVVPEGDHYRAALDVGLLTRRILALAPNQDTKGLAFEWAPISLALAPRGDGMWRFWDYRIPKMVAMIGGQRTELTTEGIDFEVITDPVTGVTPSMNGRIGRVAATSTIAKDGDPMTVTSENISSDVALQGSARPTALPGVVDGLFHQTTGSMLYSIEIANGIGAGMPDVKITLEGGRQDDAIGVRGFRHAALLDLWAHLVAHHAPEDFTAGQTALKAKIAAALPLFEAATQKVEGNDFSLESPFVILKASKASADLDLAGLTRDGRVALTLGFTGFQAYSLFMPKWAQKLVPSDMALTGKVTGYDLATPISVFLESADFTAKKPLTPEQEARMAVLFLPHGGVDVVLDGNRLVGPLYDIAVDGRLTAGPAGAKGAVTVKAKGIDKVAGHLAETEGDDRSKDLAGMIEMARQFAERKGDDLVWRFDFDGDLVAVNGKPLK